MQEILNIQVDQEEDGYDMIIKQTQKLLDKPVPGLPEIKSQSKQNETSEEESFLLGEQRKIIPKKLPQKEETLNQSQSDESDDDLSFLLKESQKQHSIDQIERNAEKEFDSSKNKSPFNSINKQGPSISILSDDDDISDSFKVPDVPSPKKNTIEKVEAEPEFSVSELSDSDDYV